MLVHRDTFSNDYWPSFAESKKSVREQIDDAQEDSMHSIKEVYDLSADIDEQVNSRRVWRLYSSLHIVGEPIGFGHV